MASVNKSLIKLHRQMDKIALAEVERLARLCLKSNIGYFNEFVMCMGTFFFTDKSGEVLYDHIAEKRIGYKRLDNFVCEWNSMLKLTGEPMRFTATGSKITDW
jgi:hypothetical protein